MIDSYKTIKTASEGFFKDRSSKFFAYAFPVKSEDEISEMQKMLRKKHYDARHHVYAFRLGAEKKHYRCSDDGEPANSSGPPVLGQLQSFNLTDVLIVVVRYFGGTKLGVPGLINAYKTAAAEAIKNAEIIEKTVDAHINLKFGYQDVNNVMRVIKEENLNIVNQEFTTDCSIKIQIRKGDAERIANKFRKIHPVQVNLELL